MGMSTVAGTTEQVDPQRRSTRALLAALLALGSIAVPFAGRADAAANTPIWIGAPFAGSYRDATRPGAHTPTSGWHVAYDFYARANTTVRFYAAPKNPAHNNQVTAAIINSGPTCSNARLNGYWAIVEVRHNGVAVGQVLYSHLAREATRGAISRWGGTVGTVAALPFNSGSRCYAVRNADGQHVHMDLKNLGSRPACAHDWGAVAIPETRYQGYLGDYGRQPLSGNRCPSGI